MTNSEDFAESGQEKRRTTREIMDLEHRVGQLLFIGLPGAAVDAQTRELLEAIQPGGVLLTERNIENALQVIELVGSIRDLLKVPPFLAVDQEGGRVDRLKPIFSAMASPDLLRASNDASAAARLGEITAEALRMLGFNLNFAPVLDIPSDDSVDNGLKGRYLGASVAEVVRLAGSYLEGLQRGGVIGVGKHFPGLGAATVDSHRELPEIDAPRDQVLKRGVMPYTELFSKINARLNGVIIAHAHYSAFDGPSPLPATLSRNVVTGLLREELGFKGLSITDDMEMGAITGTRGSAEAAVAAVEAGVDMVMVGSTSDRIRAAWEALVRAARDGRLSKQRINRSIDHIAGVKSMTSPPLQFNEMAVSRIKERLGELNLTLQHTR